LGKGGSAPLENIGPYAYEARGSSQSVSLIVRCIVKCDPMCNWYGYVLPVL